MGRSLILLLALLAMLVGAPPATDALTLEVTSGIIFVPEPFYEPDVFLFGQNWSLQGFSGTSFVGISGTFFFHATTLTLDGNIFSGGSGLQCCDNNSSITIVVDLSTIGPLIVPGFQPIDTPFTMTGLLGIGPDDGVDLVGQGTLHITRVTEGGTSNLLFIYDFSPPADSAAVAEPATLALLAPGIVAILTLRRRFLTR